MEKTKNISTKSALLLLINYFIGYNYFYPKLLVMITKQLYPSAKVVPDYLQYIFYAAMIIINVVIALPLLKQSLQKIKGNKWNLIKVSFTCYGQLLLVSLVVSTILFYFTGDVQSNNQVLIEQSFKMNPLKIIFSTLIYAPIVEEIVFRGCIFAYLRNKHSFKYSAIIASLMFGLVHVMASIGIGDFSDLINVIVYATMGFFMSLAYEKTDSIYGGMAVHLINNAFAVIV
ncbi:MAG: CPBP family intramembrane glutamic endopeptidase, partial [Erysipelotrichaceae bacterium]